MQILKGVAPNLTFTELLTDVKSNQEQCLTCDVSTLELLQQPGPGAAHLLPALSSQALQQACCGDSEAEPEALWEPGERRLSSHEDSGASQTPTHVHHSPGGSVRSLRGASGRQPELL